ncbi:SLC13 family permease [Magnetococcales bacterium HHB-1]
MNGLAWLALGLFLTPFVLIHLKLVERHTAVLAGAGSFLVLGIIFDFYGFVQIIESIYFETLALISAMSLISYTLARSGLFAVIAERAARYAGNDSWLILVLFALITYTLSTVANNLATMVVIIPMTLTLCRTYGLNPIPITMAELIASNLGGASTLVGDFPNMIIGAVGDLHFIDFIGNMMAPCLVLLAVMLLFFQHRVGHQYASSRVASVRISQQARIHDRYALNLGLSILTMVLVGFLLADFLSVRPAVIAFFGGGLILLLIPPRVQKLFSAINGGDILFFLGLFIMVGGLQAAGILQAIRALIFQWGGGNHTLELLILLWMAGLTTPLLNAGPATAFFIPVAAEMNQVIPGDTVWWALSLGVLAGSSATLTGATAGPLLLSQLEKYPKNQISDPIGPTHLDFQEYIRWGGPIMILFLGFSTFYIMVLAS